MAGYTFKNGPSIAIRCRDPRTGKSLSISVYHGDLRRVAVVVEKALGQRWRTTSLTDSRHKRRL